MIFLESVEIAVTLIFPNLFQRLHLFAIFHVFPIAAYGSKVSYISTCIRLTMTAVHAACQPSVKHTSLYLPKDNRLCLHWLDIRICGALQQHVKKISWYVENRCLISWKYIVICWEPVPDIMICLENIKRYHDMLGTGAWYLENIMIFFRKRPEPIRKYHDIF